LRWIGLDLGQKNIICRGLDWIGSANRWIGLDWISKNGPMHNSVRVSNVKLAGFMRVTRSFSGVSYQLAAVVRVDNVNLRTVKPQV